jgi:hypothetical protein
MYEKTICVKAKCIKNKCNNKIQNDCIITDIVIGKINIDNNKFNTIWQGINLIASSTIKIQNKSNNFMRLRLKGLRCNIIRILPNQEINITVQNINNIAIRCNQVDENGSLVCYEIGIHYISELNRGNRNRCCNNNQSRCCDDVDNYNWIPISCICSAINNLP